MSKDTLYDGLMLGLTIFVGTFLFFFAIGLAAIVLKLIARAVI